MGLAADGINFPVASHRPVGEGARPGNQNKSIERLNRGDEPEAAGGGEIAFSSLLGSFTSSLIFSALFAAGLVYRRQPDFHKRLMLLATLAIMWPAFFRLRHYFPGVPRPDIWFGFVLGQVVPVTLAMVHDKLTLGRMHPVYRTVGVILIAEAAAEVLLFDSAGWRVAAHWLAAPFLR